MFTERERSYVESARVGRLATVGGQGTPSVVPICYALIGNKLVTPIDEKEQKAPPEELSRVRNIRQNSRIALVIDHYTEEWTDLGWVQITGNAAVQDSEHGDHERCVAALRDKYEQYAEHALERRPLITIRPDRVRSWGTLEGTNVT